MKSLIYNYYLDPDSEITSEVILYLETCLAILIKEEKIDSESLLNVFLIEEISKMGSSKKIPRLLNLISTALFKSCFRGLFLAETENPAPQKQEPVSKKSFLLKSFVEKLEKE